MKSLSPSDVYMCQLTLKQLSNFCQKMWFQFLIVFTVMGHFCMRQVNCSEYLVSTVVTGGLVLKHQGSSSHCADYAPMLVGPKPLSEPMLQYFDWTNRNKHQWNIHWNSYIFIQETTFENVFCKMAAILSQPQCVRKHDVYPELLNYFHLYFHHKMTHFHWQVIIKIWKQIMLIRKCLICNCDCNNIDSELYQTSLIAIWNNTSVHFLWL